MTFQTGSSQAGPTEAPFTLSSPLARRAKAAEQPPPIAMASPDINEQDVEAVAAVVRSGRLALGFRAPAFERAVADYVGVEHAVAVSSGTAALHLIVKALGLGPRDEVLVPSFTFAASVNAILYEGARPVFAEMDPETFNLDVKDLEHRITHHTKAILAVDVFGAPADWDALGRIAKRYGLALIDDCCEALGAEYQGRKVGGFGQAGAFAFYPNKQVTTGEGGMIVTNRSDLAALARSYANQGRGAMGAWLEHERLGYNYRMDEMSAALGLSQFKRIEEILDRREAVARCYAERLRALPEVGIPGAVAGGRRSWFVYVVTLPDGCDRDETIEGMEEDGVPARGYFSPIHTQAYIRRLYGDLEGTLPVTEAMARRTLALPFHVHLTDAEMDRVVASLKKNMK
ncbi:MAG: DegT/DnrJ/EryC1/StrS family aminotransferase [Holophaga sp.]|jgi:perosamine synthetase